VGTSIAETLLARGIHVIQEHPVHPDEVLRLQQLAAERGVGYWVNSFYPHTGCGRCWTGVAADIRHQLQGEPPALVQLTTSRQLLYSSLDLVVRAGGWMPQDIVVHPGVSAQGAVFTDLQLQAADTTIALRLQATMDPGEPDQHSQVMHHCDFIWSSGYLSLAATYGPVSWTPALYMPGHHDEQHSLYRQPDVSSGLGAETQHTLYPAAASWQEAMEVHGPEGVAWLLKQVAARIDGGIEAADGVDSAAYQWGLAALWQQVSRSAGPVKGLRLQPPRRIDPGRAFASVQASK
jgi:thiazolinyl reductase component of yersiniabactin synthetase